MRKVKLLTKFLYDLDPSGLTELCCPEDEYSIEARALLEKRITDPSDISALFVEYLHFDILDDHAKAISDWLKENIDNENV